MPSLLTLMWLTVAGVVALFVALALYVRAISRELEEIGGPASRFYRPTNFLSKIRVGLRAIDVRHYLAKAWGQRDRIARRRQHQRGQAEQAIADA